MDSRKLIGIGFLLVLFGMVVPFLMVLHLVESTFFLNFASFTATMAGLFMGIAGASYIVRGSKK